MNHLVPSVNAGYITRSKLLSDHLRHQQETISGKIADVSRAKFKNGNFGSTKWPFLPARCVLKETLQVTESATNLNDAKLHLETKGSDKLMRWLCSSDDAKRENAVRALRYAIERGNSSFGVLPAGLR